VREEGDKERRDREERRWKAKGRERGTERDRWSDIKWGRKKVK